LSGVGADSGWGWRTEAPSHALEVADRHATGTRRQLAGVENFTVCCVTRGRRRRRRRGRWRSRCTPRSKRRVILEGVPERRPRSKAGKGAARVGRLETAVTVNSAAWFADVEGGGAALLRTPLKVAWISLGFARRPGGRAASRLAPASRAARRRVWAAAPETWDRMERRSRNALSRVRGRLGHLRADRLWSLEPLTGRDSTHELQVVSGGG